MGICVTIRSRLAVENKRIYLRHARSVFAPNGRGYCNRGLRLFAERHNLDWEDFLHNGIDIEKIRAIDDDMARAVLLEVEKDG